VRSGPAVAHDLFTFAAVLPALLASVFAAGSAGFAFVSAAFFAGVTAGKGAGGGQGGKGEEGQNGLHK
jgi:hypothetical protein